MNNKIIQKIAKLAFCATLGGLVLTTTSCRPKPPVPTRYKVEVLLDASLERASVLVDLVGVSGSDQQVWQNYSMTKYWKEGDPMRRDAKKVVADFSGQILTFTLAKNDPIWDKWLDAGATHLAVLAYLPGRFEDLPGNADQRRRLVSLFPNVWKEGESAVLKFEIKRSGINVLTAIHQDR
jgi:hypothetical protein